MVAVVAALKAVDQTAVVAVQRLMAVGLRIGTAGRVAGSVQIGRVAGQTVGSVQIGRFADRNVGSVQIGRVAGQIVTAGCCQSWVFVGKSLIAVKSLEKTGFAARKILQIVIAEGRIVLAEGRIGFAEGRIVLVGRRIVLAAEKTALAEGRIALAEERIGLAEGRIVLAEGKIDHRCHQVSHLQEIL